MSDDLDTVLREVQEAAATLEAQVRERDARARAPLRVEVEEAQAALTVLEQRLEALEAERSKLATTVLDAETAHIAAARRATRVRQARTVSLWAARGTLALGIAVGGSLLWRQTHSTGAFLVALAAVPVAMTVAFLFAVLRRG